MGYVLGIDLGTTNTCVAVSDERGARIIATPTGHRTISSSVAFTDGGIIVGRPALRQMVTNPTRTLFGTKRLIGRKVNDPAISMFSRAVSFELGPAPNGDAWVRIDDELRAPQEIAAHILSRARAFAEVALAEPVTRAVITVPAYFNESQRKATKDAGTIAGLDVIRILNEPTAAALAFGAHRVQGGRRLIAVFDIGGGTFDISIMAVHDGVFEVLATAGDMMLGGDDWDALIADALLLGFDRGLVESISADPVARSRLKEAAQKAKHELSAATRTQVELPYLGKTSDGAAFHLTRELTREEIESATRDLMDRLVAPCEQALSDAGIPSSEIEQVLLVGGMSRWPAIEASVEEIFGRKASRGANPDEIVAVGAALQGAILSGYGDDAALLDVTPQAIGVRVGGGRYAPIIPRGAMLPVRARKEFTTTTDNQSIFTIDLYQGDHSEAANNRRLGSVQLESLPEGDAGSITVEIELTVDVESLIAVTARELSSGLETSATIKASSGLTEGDLLQLGRRHRRETRQPEDA